MGTLASKELLQGGLNVDVKKRFFQKRGNAGGRDRLYFCRWSGASRQSARYAHWMPDVACQRHARQGLSRRDLIAHGFNEAIVNDVVRKVDLNEYKRKQAAPGLRITPLAFGVGRRIPIVQKYVN